MIVLCLALVLLCFLMYVVLDGYDLGVGTATLFERNATHRLHMMESVAVGWDANETWLILLAVALWSGFPLAFGAILPHLYLPVVVVLFALVVRGVSLELVSQSPPRRRAQLAFGVASLVASFGQGFALGALTSPVAIVNGTSAGSAFAGFTWFSVLAGLTVATAYLAAGYAYTKQKSNASLRTAAGRRGLLATAGAVVLTAATLVAINATAAPLQLGAPARASAFGVLLLFAAGGVAVAAATFRSTRSSNLADSLPLAGLAVATVSVFGAILVARLPVLLPPALTVDEAASPNNTLVFIVIAIGLLNMPLVLSYNLFAHRAFRGKVDTEPSPARGSSVDGALR